MEARAAGGGQESPSPVLYTHTHTHTHTVDLYIRYIQNKTSWFILACDEKRLLTILTYCGEINVNQRFDLKTQTGVTGMQLMIIFFFD